MNVYVVGTGERGEGQTPLIAFTSLDEARWYAANRWHVELYRDNPRAWKATWNGVDEVWVHRLELVEERAS